MWSEDELIGEEDELELNALQIIAVLKVEGILTVPAKYIRHLRKIIPKGLEMLRPENREIRQQLFANDILTKLLFCMKSEECPLSLLQEVVALMSQLCSGDKEETLILVNCQLIDLLLPLLSYDNFTIIEHSVLALAYIWNSCPEMSRLVNKTPFLQVLVGLIDTETAVSPSKYSHTDGRTNLLRALSWALFVICQSREPMSYKLSIHLIPSFLKLFNYCDTEVKTNVLKTLSATTDRLPTIKEEDNSLILKVVQSVVSNGALFESIISSLSVNCAQVVLNAIRIVANIVSWGESYAQIILQAKALQHFHILLNHSDSLIQKEAAFTVSNITAGNSAQIQEVIDANLIPPLVELLYMGEYRTQCEVSHVLLNISAVGSKEQIIYILNMDRKIPQMDVIDAMASMLTAPDAPALITCLNFYNNVLVFAKRAKILNEIVYLCEMSSVLFHLESMVIHKNSEIAVLATHIMDEFFSGDASFEEDITLDSSLMDDKQMDSNFSF